MKIVKTYEGFTGKELLTKVTDDGSGVEIAGAGTLLTPCTLPFVNQAEISTIEDATHVSVRTSWMRQSILVLV